MRIAVIVSCVALSMLIVAIVRAETAPATQPVSDEQLMLQWWDDLKQPDPAASRALLNFIDRPEQAVAFFAGHLKPLTLSEEQLNQLIQDLASDDDSVWKPAFEQLEYLDPRLATDVQTLMSNTTVPASRTRLVEILSGKEADSLLGKPIELNPAGEGRFIFFMRTGQNSVTTWPVETQVSALNGAEWRPKLAWTRAVRAIVALEHIASPDAVTLLKQMASGHPDAQPTKVAQEALQKVELGKQR